MRKWFASLILLLFFLPAQGVAAEKYVVLTFDDGPSGRFTRELLEGLEQRQVHATFLLCGYRMQEDPGLVSRIWEQGHEIGLHGYSHDCMGTMCLPQLRRELARSRALLPEGCEPVFLRPPGGILSECVKQVAKEEGLSLLSWTVDPRDWATNRTQKVTEAVVGAVNDGDVVLLHDMSTSSVRAALSSIDALQAFGYTFVTASELAALRNIVPEPGQLYRSFPAP